MVFLKFLTLFILVNLSVMGEVVLLCSPKNKCFDVEETYTNNGGTLYSEDLKRLSLDKSVKFLKVIREQGTSYVLIERKPTLLDIQINSSNEIDTEKILKVSGLQEGVFYNQKDFEDAKIKVESWLSERGFLEPSFKYTLKSSTGGDVISTINIGYKSKLVLRSIETKGRENTLLKELLRPFEKMVGKPYSKVNFKLSLDTLVLELKKEGFQNAKAEVLEEVDDENVSVLMDISLGNRLQFSFNGNTLIDQESLLLSLKKTLKEGTTIVRKEDLKASIEKYYAGRGVYNTKVKVFERMGKTIEGDKVKTYFFHINEGRKVSLTKLLFKGNLAVDLSKLKEIYYKNGSVLATRDFLDEKYLTTFTSILKNYYLRNGHVFVEVSKPRIVIDKETFEAGVSYSIKERQQCFLKKINIENVTPETRKIILENLKNKEGKPLNVVELEADLGRALNTIREEGYYYASIQNLNDDNVVTYESNYTVSYLNINFKPGKVTRLENIVLSGNKITKDIVLEREVKLEKGDILTPDKIKAIKDRINSLALFANVQVLPVVVNKLTEDKSNKTNLIIQVQEKQFGRGEIAPGYRTDIGAKLSFILSKTNLLRLNDSGTLKLQLNRRFSLSQFDERRANERNHSVEGIASLSYRFPYLLDFADFNGNFSVQRRRFYSFDADIFRVTPQLNKQVNSFLGLSLKYQYERIRQFDATEDKDRATFEIGSITPGITLDFRDSPVSPRSGAYLGLNWEFANQYFGSQKDENIEINFSKVISRNRFYFPLTSKSFVLALSVAAGMQQNYATDIIGTNPDGSPRTRGFIPSIKVFRLDGFDIVRGFADNEINRLEDREDITRRRVQGKAYFANLKIEPRYYVDDTFVLGPFFDAGRLFIDTFSPFDLRTSAGLTFKFLTPVGTLDFDYGVKLKRLRYDDQRRESFGRFQLSIGYF